MSNTYTQIHIQAVFAVRSRECLIGYSWKDELFRYMTGIVQNQGHKVLAINGISDHVHILFGMRPLQSLSELIQDIKGDSSKWINMKGFIQGHFRWQEGYGAFSYRKRDISYIIEYIRNQESHHIKQSFIDEYLKFLKEFEVDFDPRYIFQSVL